VVARDDDLVLVRLRSKPSVEAALSLVNCAPVEAWIADKVTSMYQDVAVGQAAAVCVVRVSTPVRFTLANATLATREVLLKGVRVRYAHEPH